MQKVVILSKIKSKFDTLCQFMKFIKYFLLMDIHFYSFFYLVVITYLHTCTQHFFLYLCGFYYKKKLFLTWDKLEILIIPVLLKPTFTEVKNDGKTILSRLYLRRSVYIFKYIYVLFLRLLHRTIRQGFKIESYIQNNLSLIIHTLRISSKSCFRFLLIQRLKFLTQRLLYYHHKSVFIQIFKLNSKQTMLYQQFFWQIKIKIITQGYVNIIYGKINFYKAVNL